MKTYLNADGSIKGTPQSSVVFNCDSRFIADWVPLERMHRVCFTSPPYWQLRDYGNIEQIGLEETPEKYIAELVKAFGQTRQRMTRDGSLFIVIGDTYFGGGSTTTFGNDFANFKGKSTLAGTHPGGSVRPIKPKYHPELRAGEQIGIPWMLAAALRADGWFIRQVSIWQKPNPMPGPFRKRFTSSHEYIIHATRGMEYFCNRAALDDGTRIMRDVVTMPVCKGGHAKNAGFPQALAELFIAAYSEPGDMVLDPFHGSGTTGKAAKKLDRFYTGVDLCK